MKHWLTIILLVAFTGTTNAQRDFMGIAKYTMSVEGDSTHRKDSMAVIFGKDKIKVILYLPTTGNWGIPAEKVFIDDLGKQTSIIVEPDSGTYRESPLKNELLYEFVNTNRFSANGRYICFSYEANQAKLDKSQVVKAECLGSIDFYKPSVSNYFFLGVQPLIVDNRIVMDFIVTQKNGQRPRINLYYIERLENTDEYFNLDGLVQLQ